MADTGAGAYRLYSAAGRPVFAAPDRPRRLRFAALDRLQPSTPKRALYGLAIRLTMLLGLDRLISQRVESPLVFPKSPEFEGLLNRLRSELHDPSLTAAIFWPPQLERQRVYVHLFDRFTPVGFAKLSFSGSDDALLHEAVVLQELASRSLRFRVPRVLACGRDQSHSFIVMEAFPRSVRPLAQRLRAYPADSVRDLAGDVRAVDTSDLEALSWWPRYLRKIDAGLKPFHEELMNKIGSCIFVCRAHGDLSPNNIVRRGRELWIFDWEDSCADAPRAADRLGFELSISLPAILADPLAWLRILKRKHFLGASSEQQLDIMLALAFRHAAGISDATLLMRHWKEVL